MPTQKRDNTYYEDRLRLEHPAVHADFLKGVHRTLAEALIAAGVRKPRTRLHELKNAWDKASQSERDEFLRHMAVLCQSSQRPVSRPCHFTFMAG